MDLPPASLSLAAFQRLIEREGTRVELKTGAGVDKLQEVMVAFSNAEGGVIFIGVRDDRTVVGRELDQSTDDAIHAAARVARDVGRYAVTQIQVGPTPIVAVTVQPRQEGFAQTSNGRVLQRRGAANPALLGHDLWGFMSSRAHRKFELTPTSLGWGDFPAVALAEVAGAHGWPSEPALLKPRLVERGLMTETEHLTIAGALLLTDPSATLHLAKASIDIRRYQDETINYDRRHSVSGPLHQQIREATRFILDEVGTDLVISGINRREVPRLPEVVVREAVANAVAHRSYELDRVTIQVSLRPGRVEIRSPGRLPEPVTIETLRVAQAARNPTVIDVLRRLHLAEDAGRGIDVIEDSMASALLDPPVFTELGDSVQVSLPLIGPMSAQERAWVEEVDRRSGLGGQERMLLVHAARGEVMTNRRAREILAIDSLTARKYLAHLVEVGLFETTGDRAGTQYHLVPTVGEPSQHRIPAAEAQRIVLAAAREQSIANEDVRHLLGVDRIEALRILSILVRDGQLLVSGERRGTRYRTRVRPMG